MRRGLRERWEAKEVSAVLAEHDSVRHLLESRCAAATSKVLEALRERASRSIEEADVIQREDLADFAAPFDSFLSVAAHDKLGNSHSLLYSQVERFGGKSTGVLPGGQASESDSPPRRAAGVKAGRVGGTDRAPNHINLSSGKGRVGGYLQCTHSSASRNPHHPVELRRRFKLSKDFSDAFVATHPDRPAAAHRTAASPDRCSARRPIREATATTHTLAS